mmetsp:Transcript_172230/g.552135  ORF Transcript_172230/g.552135 Transcript_172230/m.552135 type:complete len:592 (-) Transcript_172230:59-1834(-)
MALGGGPSRSHRRCHRLGRPRRAAAIGAATDVKHATVEAEGAALVGGEGDVGYNLLPESAYEEFYVGVATAAMQQAAAAAGAAAVGGEEVFREEDVGYNLLFETAHEEFGDRRLTASHPFPPYVKGSFVIPSLGQFEMGDRHFVGFLDSFGKLQKFEIDGDQVSATYRFLATGFYNESKKANTIGPGLLFFETEPPREPAWYNPMANMPPFAPNDNTYVNTICVGDRMLALTDSDNMLVIDPKTLRAIGHNVWEDDLKEAVCYTGSANPLPDPRSLSGDDWIDFIGNTGFLSEESTLRIFKLGADSPQVRNGVADVKMETPPYLHSFGLSESYCVLPRTPVKFSTHSVLHEPMAHAFKPLDMTKEGAQNAFYIVPLNGSRGIVKTLPIDQPIWYTHTVNTYENSSGVVIDLITTPKNPFAGDLTLQTAKNKQKRDSAGFVRQNLVKRFLLPLDSDTPVTTELLSDPDTYTDFPRVNPKYRSRKHCFYWAIEWYSDSQNFASMAVVKYDVCTGERKRVWSRKNWYPSEVAMVPSDREGAAEDEGVLLFVALDGAADASYFIGVDASSMETISEVGPFPRIGFTTHGEFYPGL